jgi:hypothetical protein
MTENVVILNGPPFCHLFAKWEPNAVKNLNDVVWSDGFFILSR